MISYALEVSFSWLVLYLVYLLFLQKESFFAFNRGYLLVSLIGSLFLPFLKIETSHAYLAEVPVFLNEISVGAGENLSTYLEHNNGYSLSSILGLIYLIGFVILSTQFILGLLKIRQLYNSASLTKQDGYYLVSTSKNHGPFSFGKYLFLSNHYPLTEKEQQYILEHEIAHIHQHHTADLLLLEIISILFWFNPLIFLYKIALRDQHEYLADQAVLHHAPIKEYGQLLLEQSIPGLKIGLVNHLIYSQLKKRINMMTKKRSLKLPILRYTACLVAFILVAWTIACDKLEEPAIAEVPSVALSSDKPTDKAYMLASPMPYLSSCETGNYEDSKSCSDQKLLQFVYNQVQYPQEAKEKGIEGMVVISFVVNTEGNVQDINIIKDVEGGCGEESKRIVALMTNNEEMKWTPGSKDGQLVNVEMKLPIRFKLK